MEVEPEAIKGVHAARKVAPPPLVILPRSHLFALYVGSEAMHHSQVSAELVEGIESMVNWEMRC